MFGKFVEIKTTEAAPITVGQMTVTPIARSIRLGLPGVSGGLVWNKPVALKAKYAGTPERTLPIIDETRQRQLLIWGLIGAFTFLFWLLAR